MTDIEPEHEALRLLHARIMERFPTMRMKGHTDQEILAEIAKDAPSSDIFLAGEERFWNTQEQFEAIIREEAIKLMQTRMTPEEMVSVVKRYVDVPVPEIMMGLLWSIGARLRRFLPGELCCYLHFRGRSGTGKSHAGELFTDISRGDWYEDIS